jgi:phosphoribosyl-AMP cyclohydrolase
MDWLGTVQFDAQGLIPAIAQDAQHGEVLMVAWMNRITGRDGRDRSSRLLVTLAAGRLWRKGEERAYADGCWFAGLIAMPT